ncbi:MAG: radical SAM protein [Thermodesulfobacteriota bacterium]
MTEGHTYGATLPAYLQSLSEVLVDPAVADSAIAQRVRNHLPHVPWTVLKRDGELPERPGGEQTVYLKYYKGRFLRFCPGTRAYRCCGYRIVHIGENCPLSCTYCILQAYFQDRVLKVWANQHDLYTELDRAFSANPDRRYRLGTGEFTDSLALEPLTGYSRDLVGFLARYPHVCLELKSKVIDLSWMDAVHDPRRVLPAWSLNAPEIHDRQEAQTASLEERLQAARECASQGFRVCLHFDPIIRYPGWEVGYDRIVDMIFDYLRPADIAYMSLGSFRCMPELKPLIARNHPQARYIYDEFITGADEKLRLLRPLRVEQFRRIVRRLQARGLWEQLYFCMESDTVWRQVFGYTPRELGGLHNHLLRRSFDQEAAQ